MKKQTVLIWICSIVLMGIYTLSPAKDVDSESRAAASWQMGDFQGAARIWEGLAKTYEASGERLEAAMMLVRLSEAAQALGNFNQAGVYLEKAGTTAGNLNHKPLQVRLLAGRANIRYGTGEPDKAEEYFKAGLELADDPDAEEEKLRLLLAYAGLMAARKQVEPAGRMYEQCLALAKKRHHPSFAVKAKIGLVRTGIAAGEPLAADGLESVYKDAAQLPPGHDKAFALIGIGRLATDGGQYLLAHKALAAATDIAGQTGNKRAYSHGLGAMGALYAANGQQGEAVALLTQAVFAAHEINAHELVYRWEWDLGRLYRSRGEMDGAITAYENAVAAVAAIKTDLAVDCRKQPGGSFRQSVGPLYFELADLLLRRGAEQETPALKQADLMAAQTTIEQMKKMELQDYFKDDCVVALEARQSALDREIPGTAVIYPVILPDRLELIVTMAGQMKSYQVNVGQESLTAQIRSLRRKIQRPASRFSRHAHKLNDWLIRPLETDLEAAGITTLVFVPDGPLRTIPMSCLTDGKQFLIEKKAIATTPGLTVTDLTPFRHRGIKILLNGITEAVQGFSPLPNVDRELTAISKLFDSRILINNRFINAAIQENLQATPYSIVHIASHGQFKKDPTQTFLLTHDDKLTLNRLENLMGLSNFRQTPVELLTLSACQTAVGDDRAALGLAGIAVKSGARCALASLWFISDAATSDMMVDFYGQLKNPAAISKARALQLAQLNLLNKKEFRHPAYWAPFLLIGNWL